MVNNKLKEIRMKEYMMSQKDFATFLDVQVKVYWSWENNKSKPTLKKALEVANKLNKNITDIWYLQ